MRDSRPAARARPLLAALLLSAAGGLAHPALAAEAPERVRVAASDRYERNRAHRFVLGGDYRDLWKTEVELPVLDLDGVGGGLTPWRRFGGLQTAVLAFNSKDGRSFTFRGTDKDPSEVLDPELHDTIVQDLVQDQMAAQHPGGPLAVSVLSEAAGVLTIHETMVVMPDTPALGEFREEFAGMVGNFYEYPMPANEDRKGFHSATEIIDHEKFGERLAEGVDDEVDVEAFLRARLLDLLIGDFDRHRKQWRWARLPGSSAWQPVPEDRDQAFVRYEGVGIRLASLYVPILQNYGPRYPWYNGMAGLTLHGWEQDRWLLARLSWPVWEAVARDVQARITDAVIDAAIAALPPEYVALDGERLRNGLRGRRDRMLEGARSFYEHLAHEVDVQGSDANENVSVVRSADGTTRVDVVRRVDDATPVRVFARTFQADETEDIRIYLRGGEDRIRVEGAPNGMLVRVIAAPGAKQIDDSRGGGTRIYDSTGAAEVHAGPGTRVDTRVYEPPEETSFTDVEDIPPRDWGWEIVPFPLFGYEKDVGVFMGLGAIYTRYGFRKHPWSNRHWLSAGIGTAEGRPRIRYDGTFRAENSTTTFDLKLGYSGIETLRFYGYGNNTSDQGPDQFFRVRNEQFLVAPSVSRAFSEDRIRIKAGPWLEFSRTRAGARLIDLLDPYGADKFGSIGASANFQLDTRKSLSDHSNLSLPFHEKRAAGYPTSGLLFDVTGVVSPPVWDVDKTWGSVEGSLAGFLSVGENARATLAVRVGGKGTFGRTPFYAKAYLGGGEFFDGDAVLRGYRAQRFAGDGSLFGNADLRIFLVRLKLVVPGDLGVFGFGDVGRVWDDNSDVGAVPGSNRDEWHPSWGGGVWFSPLTRTNTISVSVANSTEETLAYMRVGFHY